MSTVYNIIDLNGEIPKTLKQVHSNNNNNNNKCFSIAQNLQTVINALYSLVVYIIIYCLKAQLKK